MLIVLLILAFPVLFLAGCYLLGLVWGVGLFAHAAAQDIHAKLKAMPSDEEARAILERAKWRGDLGPLVEAPAPKPPTEFTTADKVFWWFCGLFIGGCVLISLVGRLFG